MVDDLSRERLLCDLTRFREVAALLCSPHEHEACESLSQIPVGPVRLLSVHVMHSFVCGVVGEQPNSHHALAWQLL
jgi:hypothetical protein